MLGFIPVAYAQSVDVQRFIAQLNVDWSRPSWDLFIIIFFVVASFLYGVSLGRDRIIVILVSIYMSMAVVATAPFLKGAPTEVGVSELFVFKVTSFLGAFVVLFFLLSRSALLKTIAAADYAGTWWQVLLFSVLHVGLLISITLSYLPGDALNQLAPLTKQIFTGQNTLFYWVAAPILAMALMRGESKRGRIGLEQY